jgi:16S rRNA processing protein RimM
MRLLNAGRVGRPHGLDGSFHVTRPRATLLALGGAVRVGATVREIVRRAGTVDGPILRLDGIDDRAAVEALRGEELLVTRADAPPLPAGEYWAEDLEGCAVVTPDGRELGHVQRMRALPSCEVLEVGELLVPMVADAVLAIELDDRRIVVDPAFLGVTPAQRPTVGREDPSAGPAQRPTAGREDRMTPAQRPTVGREDPSAGPDAPRR